jgi:hypothetical protein
VEIPHLLLEFQMIYDLYLREDCGININAHRYCQRQLDPCNEAGIQSVVLTVVLAAGYSCGSEVSNIERKRADMIGHKNLSIFVSYYIYSHQRLKA